MEKLIKSKERVRDYAEVFTPTFIVKDMCDLVSDECHKIHSTFLEPACGTGNFLAEVLSRKFSICKSLDDGLDALLSIFGIDIQLDNVQETRKRLLDMFIKRFPLASSNYINCATMILTHNIAHNNALKLTEEQLDRWANGGLLPYYEEDK